MEKLGIRLRVLLMYKFKNDYKSFIEKEMSVLFG
ncbi:hypothetical protein B0H69_004244 [Clostridium beijerinckii]|nr:hypothetical protein [Clostridium beijerinckii]NRU50200.1 hypothetical protein [Clostridium beijerinckii]NRZ31802.1 hypothetical protein [Clostridium beijerinckii]NSA11015.1 hypothetical protein [Clostridium beijerinckii]NSA60832.1 hypothetical protein [Clostridium beijerinckii]